jgi:hypothetical protein
MVHSRGPRSRFALTFSSDIRAAEGFVPWQETPIGSTACARYMSVAFIPTTPLNRLQIDQGRCRGFPRPGHKKVCTLVVCNSIIGLVGEFQLPRADVLPTNFLEGVEHLLKEGEESTGEAGKLLSTVRFNV